MNRPPPGQPERRSGTERRLGRPRETPDFVIAWAADQVQGGRSNRDVAKQLGIAHTTLERRIADRRQRAEPRRRCPDCETLTYPGASVCPNGHALPAFLHHP